MEQSNYQPRQYFFSGNSIILDQYADINERFDQNFEDAVIDPSYSVVRSQYQSHNYEMSQSEYVSQPHFDNNCGNTQSKNLNSQQNRRNSGNSRQNQQTVQAETNEFREDKGKKFKLVPQQLLETFRRICVKKLGYMPHDHELLNEKFQEYRKLSNSKEAVIKDPIIIELLKHSDEDVNYSLKKLQDEYRKNIEAKLEKQKNEKNSQSENKTTSHPKLDKKILNRLYPYQKQKTSTDFKEFFKNLIDAYNDEKGTLSNKWGVLMDYLSNQKNKNNNKKIQWEDGAKDLETKMREFLSSENLIKRLQNMYQKSIGFYTTNAESLIDYWEKKIPEKTKYQLGLYSYDRDVLYKLLKKNEQDYKEEKQKEEEQLLEDLKRNERENEENKRTKEEYEKLQKKFDKLAKPKDKWKTGRVMLKLKKMFKYDNIIKKMIKNEFMDNKPFKYPEEYAIYDDDDARKTVFRSGLEKQVPKLNDQKVYEEMEDKPKKYLEETYENDKVNDEKIDKEKRKIYNEDCALEKYLREQAIEYYKRMKQRLINKKFELISKLLNRIYANMLTEHPNATKRKFKKIGYSTFKKAGKFKKMHIYYPNSLKYYFFSLVRRIGENENGELEIAPLKNLPFWGSAMSNNCKVHSNGCPVDCIYNTHNDMLLQQRSSNYKQIYAPNKMKELRKDERFNFWKRPELIEEKEKIFMNLGDAKNCTFEPKINKLDKDEDVIKGLSKEELVQKRLHNREWVNKMGPEFKDRFPLVYKEGMCKFVKGIFAEGRYDKALNELKKAFNLDKIEAFFDAEKGINTKKKVQPKKQAQGEEKKDDSENEPKKESKIDKENNDNQNNNNYNNNQSNMNKNDKKEQNVREDNFSNTKNR